MSEWREYSGSYEQISELKTAKSYSLRLRSGTQILSKPNREHDVTDYCGGKEITHYLICHPHPLAKDFILWINTGQPVWYKHRTINSTGECNSFHMPFIQPETYDYSFTEFKGEV